MKKVATKTKGQVWAVKTRQTKANAWMPEACFVRLEGERGPRGFLDVCGWSSIPDKTAWPIVRLKRYLAKIIQQWQVDYGLGWKLEIRAS